MGNTRARLQAYIKREREFEPSLTEEALTQKFIAELPTDIALADNAFWRDEASEAAYEIAHNFARLFNHGAQSDKDREEALLDEQMVEGFYTVADLLGLVGLNPDRPPIIEFIEFTEELKKDEIEDHHPGNQSDPNSEELPNDMVRLTTSQVRYGYPTALPGIELVVQFPVTGRDHDHRFYSYFYESRQYDGKNYDFPLGLDQLHSLRLAVAPVAYAASLEDSPVDQPPA